MWESVDLAVWTRTDRVFAGAWVLSCNAGGEAWSALSQWALRCMTVRLAWFLGKTFGDYPMPFVCQVSRPFDTVLLFLLLLYSLVGAHRWHVSVLLFTSPQLIWEVGRTVDVSQRGQEEDH